MRARRFLLIALLLLGGAATTAAAATFRDYPAPVYKGAVRQPGFKGAQRDYAAYRTRIRNSVRAGVGFGGHYALAVIGCGTSCRFGYITDLKTGVVYELPYGGEDYYQILYRVRPDSRLLQTQWQPYEKEGTKEACQLEDFVWTGRAFKSLGRRHAPECPEWNDFA